MREREGFICSCRRKHCDEMKHTSCCETQHWEDAACHGNSIRLWVPGSFSRWAQRVYSIRWRWETPSTCRPDNHVREKSCEMFPQIDSLSHVLERGQFKVGVVTQKAELGVKVCVDWKHTDTNCSALVTQEHAAHVLSCWAVIKTKAKTT